MKCSICDCEAAYTVFNYGFCKDHYNDLIEKIKDSNRGRYHLVKFFIKTKGSMNADISFDDFYNAHVVKL